MESAKYSLVKVVQTEKNIEVLSTILIPSLTSIYGDSNLEGINFQKDKAPNHKSAVTTIRWLSDNEIVHVRVALLIPGHDPHRAFLGRIKNNSITSKSALANGLKQE